MDDNILNKKLVKFGILLIVSINLINIFSNQVVAAKSSNDTQIVITNRNNQANLYSDDSITTQSDDSSQSQLRLPNAAEDSNNIWTLVGAIFVTLLAFLGFDLKKK